MPSLRPHFLLLLILLCSYSIRAQEESKKKRINIINDIQVGMVTGGQISNEQFVYKSGFIVQYSINTRLSPWLDAGIGIALELLETETVLPIFLDFKGRFKEGERSPLLGLNIGSSNGWSTYYRNFSDYEYSGGFYISPYYAFQFPISEKMDFMLVTGYVHQVGWIEFFTEYDEVYRESFSLDFLTVRAGLRF